MARPPKLGLQYYNIDCDVFLNRKIRRLIQKYNGDGYLIYSYILTEIYRDKGYYLDFDKEMPFDVSDKLKIDENIIVEVIKYCTFEIDLFDKNKYIEHGILTSVSIQERWTTICHNAKRTNKKTEMEYSLSEDKLNISVVKTPLLQEVTPLLPEETTQSKESKQKQKKININSDGIYENLLTFETHRCEEFKKLTDDERNRLSTYGVFKPDIRITEKTLRPYIDAVEVLIAVSADKDWLKQIRINYKLEPYKETCLFKEFVKKYITTKSSYDETGFKTHFVNTIRKSQS
jgi:hypothetical protein